MKFVRVQIDGKTLTRDAAGFARLQDQYKGVDLCPTCIECGRKVFLNDIKGAKGIRAVNLEITARGRRMRTVGFSHYKGNDATDCTLYFSNDPRYGSLRDGNRFDILEKARNQSALADPRNRDDITIVQEFFMHRLTGSPAISSDDRLALRKAEDRLSTMAGLADHVWIVGFVTPLLINSRIREFGGDGELFRVEYKGAGRQSFPYRGLDGSRRLLILPQELELCFSEKDGREPDAVRRGDQAVRFELSKAFADKLVRSAVAEAYKAEPEPKERPVRMPTPAQQRRAADRVAQMALI